MGATALMLFLSLQTSLPMNASTATPGGTWQIDVRGEAWCVSVEPQPCFDTGELHEAVAISLPGNVWVRPVVYARARCVLPRVPDGKAVLSFRVSDSFIGPTAGYIFAEVHVNGRPVWSSDVAGGRQGLRRVRVEIGVHQQNGSPLTIDLGVWLRKTVSNFPVRVVYTNVELVVADGTRIELTKPVQTEPFEDLPADLPLPTVEPTRGWPDSARIVQPWGHSQAIAVKQHAVWAKRLSDEFAFNTIIMLPPNAHNAIAAEGAAENAHMRITEQQFADALADYRARGFRVILYASIMHCGHDPAWQFGDLARRHPEWSQRDPDGAPIVVYGHDWLCPSTPALGYTIDYTASLIRRWQPDAVMLDNNQFMNTATGKPTCYCDACQRGFRQYVASRFGPERAKRLLAVTDLTAMRIPTEDGTLYRVWKHWRNRVWAEATGAFRTALRKRKPDLVVLANTQYLYASWALATDLQYGQEDAVLSESRGQDGPAMSAKMLLGRAMARGRPLWNYLGTFREKDYHQLRSPDAIASISSASLANGANPWIVFYGFQTPSPSLEALAQHMRLARRWLEASVGANRWTNVVSLFSPRGRDYLNRPLMPGHLGALRRAQIPVEPLRVRDLPRFDLGPYDAVIADGIACLSRDEARALARWVRQGGTLLATPDTGWYDPIGRLRPASLLKDSLDAKPPATKAVGQGRVVWCESPVDVVNALKANAQPVVQLDPDDASWELVAYRRTRPPQLWVHAICHGKPTGQPPALKIRLPSGTQPVKATWWTVAGDVDVPCEHGLNIIRVRPPRKARYAILDVQLR